MTSRDELEAVVEAILFAAGEPVPRARLLEVFDPEDREGAAAAIDAVVERFRAAPERGFVAEEVGGGVRLVTRPELNAYLRRYFEVSGSSKLSMAALETLAIVAYRQPVTGPEIQELRGVSAASVLKTLLERRLIRIAGRKDVVGRPFVYRTTREFLMHFGLKDLAELPPLEEFEEAFGADGGALDGGSIPRGEGGLDREETVLREAADAEARAGDGEAEA